MWVKICGTTNLDDAQAAVDAGADALGFIFAESPRRVQPAVAAEIARALPEPVEKIGVFINESKERIRDIVEEAGLTGVQLHADDSLEAAGNIAVRLRSPRNLRVIAAVSMWHFRDLAIHHGVDIDFTGLDTVIFDTLGEEKRGGTHGVWTWPAALRASPGKKITRRFAHS
jgi:phosphoribosylanthranilate isomerase